VDTDGEMSAALREQVTAIIGKLEADKDEAVSARSTVETRWLAALRRYHGRYDDTMEKYLAGKEGSKHFANITRPKTQAWADHTGDLLFPTDEKNWGIQPTPAPELAQAVSQAPDIDAMKAEGKEPTGPDYLAAQKGARAKALMDAAKRSSEAMEVLMDDQLVECRYEKQARVVIKDGCKIGTGVLKGPIDDMRPTERWMRKPMLNEMGQPVGESWALVPLKKQKPSNVRVNPWYFYPAPNASSVETMEYSFELHPLNKKQMRSWARKPGFDKEAIRGVLQDGPTGGNNTVRQNLRAVTGDTTPVKDEFEVWEFRGSLDKDDVEQLYRFIGNEAGQEAISEMDILNDIPVVIYFCQGRLLKFSISHLDRNCSLYSVFNFVKDEDSIWGFGIPDLLADDQEAMNAAWRMMMDNGGLGTGPQVLIDKSVVVPADGKWTMAPHKEWLFDSSKAASRQVDPFKTFNINMHQAELAGIMTLAKEMADLSSGLPAEAQGEQGVMPQQTATGMALLMGSANTMKRGVARNFDDDITVPALTRLYDWNMQFSDDPDIKGDMEIEARGSSTLLLREIQAENMFTIAERWSVHPVLGSITKAADAARAGLKALGQSPSEVLMTKEEIEAEEQRQAENPPPPDPEMMKLQAQLQIAQMENSARVAVAEMNRDTAMIKLASEERLSMAELQAKLQMTKWGYDSKERLWSAEAAFKDRQGDKEISADLTMAALTGSASQQNQIADPSAGTRFGP